MKKIGKIVTLIVSIAGGGSGLWAAYTVSVSENFKQTLNKHDALAKSFADQISSADKRGDDEESLRVRKSYESFEENWRNSQSVVAIINSNINLAPDQVAESNKDTVVSWVTGFGSNPDWVAAYEPIDIGNAWFLAGNYEKAISGYQAALVDSPDDSASYFGQARAYGYLALNSANPADQSSWYSIAVNNAEAALVALGDVPLPAVVEMDDQLSKVVSDAQKQLTSK